MDHLKFLVSAGMAAAALAGASPALALPDVKVAGNVQYMTGGIGSDESAEMLAAARRWPLALEFAVRAGDQNHWIADVDVAVIDRDGRTVLQARCDGPLMLARLAPGSYTVRATAAGRTVDRKVHIAPGESARAVLVWPAQSAIG